MKLFKNVSFAAALIFTTALLISAFILFFSYAGCSPKNDLKKISPDKTSVAEVPVADVMISYNKTGKSPVAILISVEWDFQHS